MSRRTARSQLTPGTLCGEVSKASSTTFSHVLGVFSFLDQQLEIFLGFVDVAFLPSDLLFSEGRLLLCLRAVHPNPPAFCFAVEGAPQRILRVVVVESRSLKKVDVRGRVLGRFEVRHHKG